MPTNENHGLNHRSINETSNQCRGGGVWVKNKLAFNDATEPSESVREEITIIKHLFFLTSDSVAFICLPLHLHLYPLPFFLISLRCFFPPLFLSFFLLFRVLSSLCEEQRRTLSSGWWRGLLRVSVIFGCDISIAGLNVWCQPIYYPVTRERRIQRYTQATKNGTWRRMKEGRKGDLFSLSKVYIQIYSFSSRNTIYSDTCDATHQRK